MPADKRFDVNLLADDQRRRSDLLDELVKGTSKLVEEGFRALDESELASRRFERSRLIVSWLTEYSHFMEPPTVTLYKDGSGTLHVGSKTLEEKPDLRRDIERVVGSKRWNTKVHDNGAIDLTLTFCHLELEAPIPYG